MRARGLALWVVFLLVHVLVAWLGWVYPTAPMGDVYLVYQPWSASALSGGAIVGITEPWVYPHVALVPMLIAQVMSWPLTPLFGSVSAYIIAWAVLVTVIDLIALRVLLGGRASGPRRRQAAWFWTAALFLLGPIGIYRIDAITVPLAIMGGVWLVKRPAVSAAILTIGAWIKIWPGALVLAAIVALRQRMRVLGAAVLTTGAVVLVLALLGAGSNIFGFLTEQTGRGLQIEAVAATPFLWLARAGVAAVSYSHEMLTFQISAPAVDLVSAALTPLMALVVLAVVVLGAIKAVRGAAFARLFPPLALALVAGLIATNKVGSPQFQTWLIAPVVLWIVLDRTRATAPAILVLVLSGLTCLIYPLTYDGLLNVELLPVLLITLRNLVLLVLFVVAVRALLRVPLPARKAIG